MAELVMIIITLILLFLSMYLGGKCWKTIFSPATKKKYSFKDLLKDFSKSIMFFVLYMITLLVIMSLISVISTL